MRNVELFGMPVRPETLPAAVATVDRIVQRGEPTIHVVLNAAKVSQIARDPSFHRLLRRFDLVHADGAPVVWTSQVLGTPLPERVAGIDLMEQLVALAAERGYRPYFLGSRPQIVEGCVEELRRRHPRLSVAGWHHGFWRPDDPEGELEVVSLVRQSRADMLFVALPTPRKEHFLCDHKEALRVPFSMGVGGAFEVFAGTVRRAPVAWQRSGLEWAYRLLQNPRGLWKRYLKTNPHFLWLAGKEVVRRRLG